MKYLRQFALIMAVTCVGETLKFLLPLPIPASIYGLVLMFVLLCTGIVRLKDTEQAGIFLVEIMPVMFIPAGTGLILAWDTLRPVLVPVMVIVIASTFFVMAVTGKISDRLVKHTK